MSVVATVSQAGRSATSVNILAANANRVSLILYSESAAIVYIKCGAVATTSDYSLQLTNNTYVQIDQYTGQIDAIWNSAGTGSIKVTEFTSNRGRVR